MQCYICKKNNASRKNTLGFEIDDDKVHCVCDSCFKMALKENPPE